MLNIFRKTKNKKTNNGDEESRKIYNINADKEYNKLADPLIEEMIKKISNIGTTTVREIMVPRIDALSIRLGMQLDEIIRIVTSKGHSRIPVWEDSIDNIIGILYIKDLFNYLLKDYSNEQKLSGKIIEEINLKEIIRDVYFVPETKKILSLFREFQYKKIHLAIIIDEYGGFSGIVTLEDILEEIVGDIQDEYDNEEDEIRKISGRIFLIDARTSIEDINENLAITLPTEDSDTIGGFVFNLFDKIPEKNDTITFENFEFQINEIEGNKIIDIKLKIYDKLPDIINN